MKITLHAVGRMKNGPERELCQRYLDRFSRTGPPLGLEFAGLLEVPESRARDVSARQADEAIKLGPMAGKGAAIVLFDEAGRSLGSQDFAGMLGAMRDDGIRDCVLAIGGPDGHDPAMKAMADRLLSFGRMTWPHQLARIMVAEQLYRAATILSGHPYHRE